MKKFEFTGLRVLHKDMVKKGEERATFSFEYNKKPFSCIFLTDITPYRLYLTTLGLHPIVIEFEIQRGYLTPCYIEDYKMLVEYLEIAFSPIHKFLPVDFFEVLNRNIPEKLLSVQNIKRYWQLLPKEEKLKKRTKSIFVDGEEIRWGKMCQKKILRKQEVHLAMRKQKCVSEKILVLVGLTEKVKKN